MMNQMEINQGGIALAVPDGFSVLSAEDLRKPGKVSAENEWVIRDEEKHLILEIVWKRAPLLSGFVKIGQTASNTEKYIAGTVPFYEKGSALERTIGGEKACGFNYSYTVSGVKMTADYLVLKHGKQYFSFSCLGRKDTFEVHRGMFDAILKTVEFR